MLLPLIYFYLLMLNAQPKQFFTYFSHKDKIEDRQ